MSFISDLIEGMFFRTDSLQYWSAGHYGLSSQKGVASGGTLKDSESIQYEIILPAPGTSDNSSQKKGFVLFFHSAQFNMSYNLQQIAFLALAGIPVVIFDYRGCGYSNGPLGLAGMDADASEVWQKLESIENLDINKVVLFGQGVGADAALRFFLTHRDHVKGVVLESVYATQSGWIKDRYGPIVGDVLSALFNPTDIQPVDVLPQVEVPLLLVKPQKDTYVRASQSAKVQDSLPSQAEIWEEKGRKYLGVFSENSSKAQSKLVAWVRKRLSG